MNVIKQLRVPGFNEFSKQRIIKVYPLYRSTESHDPVEKWPNREGKVSIEKKMSFDYSCW